MGQSPSPAGLGSRERQVSRPSQRTNLRSDLGRSKVWEGHGFSHAETETNFVGFSRWGEVGMDTLSRKERSQRMSLIRNRDTKPELLVRRLIHGCGFRYRLHRADLPGKPDLVFPSRKKVIFVHGCFWHRHPACGLARLPKSRLSFWVPKLKGNRRRDLKNIRTLERVEEREGESAWLQR